MDGKPPVPAAVPKSRRATPAVLHPSWYDPEAVESVEVGAPQEAMLAEAGAAPEKAAALPEAAVEAAPVLGVEAAVQSAAVPDVTMAATAPQAALAATADLVAGPGVAAQEAVGPAAGRLAANVPDMHTAVAEAAVSGAEAAEATATTPSPSSSTAAVPAAAAVEAAESGEVAAAPDMAGELGPATAQPALTGAAAPRVVPPEAVPEGTVSAKAAPEGGHVDTDEGGLRPDDGAVRGASSMAQGHQEATPGVEAPAAAGTHAADSDGLRGSAPPHSPAGPLSQLVLTPAHGGDLEEAAAQQQQQQQQRSDQPDAAAGDHEGRSGVNPGQGAHEAEAVAVAAGTGDPAVPLQGERAPPDAVSLGPRLVVSSPRCLAPGQSDRWTLAGRCQELGDRLAHQQLQRWQPVPQGQQPAHRRPSPNRQVSDGGPTTSRTSAGPAPAVDEVPMVATAFAGIAESRLTVLLANATNPASTTVSKQQHRALEVALLRYIQLQSAAEEALDAGAAGGALQLGVRGPEPCRRVALDQPELVALPLELQHGHTLQLAAEHCHHHHYHSQQHQPLASNGTETGAAQTATGGLHSATSAPLLSAARAAPTSGHGGLPAAGMATSFVATCTSRDWASAGADVSMELSMKLITCAIPGAMGLHQVRRPRV